MATKNLDDNDLTLVSVMARFSTEEAAREYFESAYSPYFAAGASFVYFGVACQETRIKYLHTSCRSLPSRCTI